MFRVGSQLELVGGWAPPQRAASTAPPAVDDSPLSPADVDRALAGDAAAMARLVRALRPALQAEVAWTLERFAPRGRGRDPRQEVFDMVQEVFLALLERDGALLRKWDPERGRTLVSFARLLARHHVVSTLRSHRRNPWTEEPTPTERMSAVPGDCEELRLAQVDEARRTVEALRQELKGRSMLMFEGLYVEERSVEEVCQEFGLSRDALYTWRTRLRQKVSKIAAKLRGEP